MIAHFFRRRQLLMVVGVAVFPIAASAQTPPPPPVVPAHSSSTPETEHKFVPPKSLLRPPVSYPELAHLNRAEGVVRVRLSIDETGKVNRAVVSKSSGSILIDEVVKDYNLLHWTFEPATLDGAPIPSVKEQEFEFRLDPTEQRSIALKRLSAPFGTPDAPYPKEALPLKLRGSVTIKVHWTDHGLVDLIYLDKGSGHPFLDHAALRWAYENWRIDPAQLNEKNKNDEFTKTISFEPPS